MYSLFDSEQQRVGSFAGIENFLRQVGNDKDFCLDALGRSSYLFFVVRVCQAVVKKRPLTFPESFDYLQQESWDVIYQPR